MNTCSIIHLSLKLSLHCFCATHVLGFGLLLFRKHTDISCLPRKRRPPTRCVDDVDATDDVVESWTLIEGEFVLAAASKEQRQLTTDVKLTPMEEKITFAAFFVLGIGVAIGTTMINSGIASGRTNFHSERRFTRSC